MTALNTQIGGDHYRSGAIQPVEFIHANDKMCRRCNQAKPRSPFSAHAKHSDGLQSFCKGCYSEIARARRIGKPCLNCGTPKEVGVPKGARLCLTCAKVCFVCMERPRRSQSQRCLPCQLSYNRENKRLPENVVKARISRISHKYKVTRDEATRLHAIKECQVCRRDVSPKGDAHIDHCHSSGGVRGVLCFNCNACMGHVNDDVERLIGLAGYLAKFKGGAEDLRKARHYIDLLLKLEYGEGA